jgi:hypothetical protein
VSGGNAMLRGLLYLFVCLFPLTSLAAVPPSIKDGRVTITDAPGGGVQVWEQKWTWIKKKEVPVKIDGPCASACTMVLDVENLCITSRAVFQFHMAYFRFGSGGAVNSNYYTAAYLYNHYPSWVRSWIKSQGGLRKDDQKLIDMPYAYAKNYLPTCGRS